MHYEFSLVSAQIDLVGVPWLVISDELSRAPNGGDVCVLAAPATAFCNVRRLYRAARTAPTG